MVLLVATTPFDARVVDVSFDSRNVYVVSGGRVRQMNYGVVSSVQKSGLM